MLTLKSITDGHAAISIDVDGTTYAWRVGELADVQDVPAHLEAHADDYREGVRTHLRMGLPVQVVTPLALADEHVAAKARIDALSESLCNAVITPGSAQMARYQRKEAQARAYLVALEAGALPADAAVLAQAYPAVVGEVGITAETPEGVARVIVAMADAWWAYGDAVEAARLAGKRAVEAAGTPEAVHAAEAAIVWPAVPS